MLPPTIDRYMTRNPHSIESTQSLARAKDLMARHHIRHLPVIDGDRLVGIVGERDLAVVDAIPGVELERVEIARIMSPPLTVRSDASLDEVSDVMRERKADCVLVSEKAGVAGIFTAVDALAALSDLLQRVTA